MTLASLVKMADDKNSLLVDGKTIFELSVTDLKKELDLRGLSKLGSKIQLAERLKAQLLLEKKKEMPSPSGNEDTKGQAVDLKTGDSAESPMERKSSRQSRRSPSPEELVPSRARHRSESSNSPEPFHRQSSKKSSRNIHHEKNSSEHEEERPSYTRSASTKCTSQEEEAMVEPSGKKLPASRSPRRMGGAEVDAKDGDEKESREVSKKALDGAKESKERQETDSATVAAAEPKLARRSRWQPSHSGSTPSEDAGPAETNSNQDYAEEAQKGAIHKEGMDKTAVQGKALEISSSTKKQDKADSEPILHDSSISSKDGRSQPQKPTEPENQNLTESHDADKPSSEGERDLHEQINKSADQESEAAKSINKLEAGKKDETSSKRQPNDRGKESKSTELASKQSRRLWSSKSREEQTHISQEKAVEKEEGEEKGKRGEGDSSRQPERSKGEKKEEKAPKSKSDKTRLGDNPIVKDCPAPRPSDIVKDGSETTKPKQDSSATEPPKETVVTKSDRRTVVTKADRRTLETKPSKDSVQTKTSDSQADRDRHKERDDKGSKKDYQAKREDRPQTENKDQKKDIDPSKDIPSKRKEYTDRSDSRPRSRSVSPTDAEPWKKGRRDQSSSSSSSSSRSRSGSDSRSSGSKSRSGSKSTSSQSSSSDSEDDRKHRPQGSVSIARKKRSPSPKKPAGKEKAHGDGRAEQRAGRSKEDKVHDQREEEVRHSEPKSPRLAEKREEKVDSGKSVPLDKPVDKVESRTFRRFGSASKGKEAEDAKKADDAGDGKDDKDKPVRKRKWGSSKSSGNSKRTTLEISTDSLKGLIELPSEPVLELEAGEAMFLDSEEALPKQVAPQPAQQQEKSQQEQQQQQDKRDVKIKRTVVMREEEEEEEEEEEPENDTRRVEAIKDASPQVSKKKKKSGDDKDGGNENDEPAPKPHKAKKLKVIKRDMEVIVGPKEPPPKEKKVEEPSKPQEVPVRRLSQPLVPADEPEKVTKEQSPPRKPVNRIIHIINLVRPFTVGQLKQLLERTGTLVVSGFWINSIKSHCYATFEKEEHAVATRKALHGARWPQSNPKTLRVDFADQEEMDRRRAQEEGGIPPPRPQPAPEKKQPSPPPAKERRTSVPEPERKREERPVREWDRGKRSRSPIDRSISGGRVRSRSRERVRVEKVGDRQRERERHPREQNRIKERKEKKQAEAPKVEEEPPAKLLDDLFRKTKATPCIYWLPLTEEQAKKRHQIRLEKMAAEKKQREEEDEAARKKASEYRRDAVSPTRGGERDRRDRDDSRGGGARDRDRDRDRQRERDRSRDDRRRGGGGRSSSRDRSSRQDRSHSRDRRRR